MIEELQLIQQLLSKAILKTPTGELRSDLTEINIYLLTMIIEEKNKEVFNKLPDLSKHFETFKLSN